MKKCSVIFILLCLVSVFMTSCTSIKGLLNPDYTVSYGESVQTVSGSEKVIPAAMKHVRLMAFSQQ